MERLFFKNERFKRGCAVLAGAIISSSKSQAAETQGSEERTRRDEFELENVDGQKECLKLFRGRTWQWGHHSVFPAQMTKKFL